MIGKRTKLNELVYVFFSLWEGDMDLQVVGKYRWAYGPPLFLYGALQQVGASLVLVHALPWAVSPLLHARQQYIDEKIQLNSVELISETLLVRGK